MTRPLAITGMHRAGTSMIARAAQQLGLHLGHPDDLIPAAPDNPDGFFEHAGLVAASDALFQSLGAAWDCPSVLNAADLDRPGLDTARDLARPVLAELATHGAWAWKDPRVAPVVPFWVDLVPDVGVVICLRNPLEVAASLRARNGMSLALGLRLWYLHMDAATAAAGDRLVTHYDAWFHRPEQESVRLSEFVGLDADAAQLTAAAAVPARHLRHARFDAPALRTARLHPELRDLYQRLTAEAGWSDGANEPTLNGNAAATPAANDSTAAPGIDPRPLGQVHPWVVDVGVARYEVHKRNGRVAQLEQRLVEATSAPATPPQAASVDDLQASIYDLQLAVAELTARFATGIGAEQRATDLAYARMIRGVRADIRRLVPLDADVLVLSEDEPALVDLHGRRARHFPVGPSPLAPGHHPATGAEAAAHLVVRQALGATHLVVPPTAAWWLGAYPELADRLTRAATVLSRSDDGATIVRLHTPTEPTRFPTLASALDAGCRRIGLEPTVLDATSAGGGPGTFRPPEPAAALLYLDASVDVVLIDASATDERRADALRVASIGVLAGGPDGWSWTWTGATPPVHAAIVVAGAPLENPATYLDELVSTLPRGHHGELVVLTPPGPTDAWRRAADGRSTVVTGGAGAALADLAGRSHADHVVLVDGSAIPLEGWLPALLAPFARSGRVGLVAGRRRGPAGTALLAAHAVDGDRLQPTPGVEGDHLTRPIDIAVPGLAAWRRDLLVERSLDDGFATLEFALADHCWALAASGHECLVQPDAETADLGVSGPSPEALAIDRARFDEAWAAVP